MTMLLEAQPWGMIDILGAACRALTQVNMHRPEMPRSSKIRCAVPAKSWTIIIRCYNLKLIQIFRSAASAANQQQILAPELQP